MQQFLIISKAKTIEKSIFLSPINCYEVQSLKFGIANQACCYDDILVTVLTALSPYIIEPLVYIFNSCIASSAAAYFIKIQSVHNYYNST